VTPPPPRRRTISEVAAPYVNYLVRVPPADLHVCDICHGVVSGYSVCYPCHAARRKLAGATADVTAFVSLAPRGEQFAYELIAYKNPRIPDHHRRRLQTGLAAVLWTWLGRHEACLAGRLSIRRFDVITTVPSTSGRPINPLRHLVSGVVSGSAERYRDLLGLNRTDLDQRAHAADRYHASRELRGARVLVIDDTWTTGAHAQSASAALKTAGAEAVGIVALGRWLNPSYGATADWLAKHRRPGWDWTRCCLEPDTPSH
jgi:hypothetical protein